MSRPAVRKLAPYVPGKTIEDPTEANFYAVRVPVSATRTYNDLLQRGNIVRSGDALSMPGALRITIGSPEENMALIDAFDELLPQWKTAAA